MDTMKNINKLLDQLEVSGRLHVQGSPKIEIFIQVCQGVNISQGLYLFRSQRYLNFTSVCIARKQAYFCKTSDGRVLERFDGINYERLTE
jgi:hypothetical protein